ncbi:hypothetical protein CALVIDRAFT_536759 [Calocera viscosa TUFC12733]|uniref:Uncharacterized protein n=1 Tax=Calocera viscosa (strain TUFC12733) TaxID=1330018 RepID=A0A167MLD5_CALVF|nr:hypothetical protein CALVIDRAFT_536759 [Calocera viscosa TUFC12733]
MKLATLADLKTADGSPTREILLLREQRPDHWLRAHGYRLLSKISKRSLPPELWHHTANFLEADRGRYTWHAVIAAFEDLTGNDSATVALEQVSLPILGLVKHGDDVVSYEEWLTNYLHDDILPGHPTLVFLEDPAIWRLPFPLQEGNPYRLYQGLESADVVRHLHYGHCPVCRGSRELCPRPLSVYKKCHRKGRQLCLHGRVPNNCSSPYRVWKLYGKETERHGLATTPGHER